LSHAADSDNEEIAVREPVPYTAATFRDPFVPVSAAMEVKPQAGAAKTTTTVVSLPDMVLQGMVWGGSFPQAIINGRVVKIGDQVSGAEVLDITKEGVLFLYGNNRCLLTPQVVPISSKSSKAEGGKK